MEALLSDQIIFMFIPFTFNEIPIIKNNSIWQETKLCPNDKFLFNYVHDFYHPIEIENTPISLISYSLKKSFRELNDNKNISKFFDFKHSYSSVNNSFLFYFEARKRDSILAPHLWLMPLSNIGILTFSIKLSGKISLNDFMDFQYLIRSYTSGQDDKFQIQIKTTSAEALTEYEKIMTFLLSHDSGIIGNVKRKKDGWSFRYLINFLLRDLEKTQIELITNERIHTFSFIQTEKAYPSDTFQVDFYRVVKLFNRKYIPSDEAIAIGKTIEYPFESISWGVGEEGSAIGVNIDVKAAETPQFLIDFKVQAFITRYLWIYILAYYQRVSLISLIGNLTKTYTRKSDIEKEYLMKLLNQVSIVHLRSIFTEISYVSQHNDFYNLCKKNLKITALIDELKEKIHDIERIINYKNAEAALKNEQEHKSRELEAAKKDKRLNEYEKKRDKELSVLLGALFIPQIWFTLLASPYFTSIHKQTFDNFSFFGYIPLEITYHTFTLLSLILVPIAIFFTIREAIRLIKKRPE